MMALLPHRRLGKMTVHNIAVVFAPVLFYIHGHKGQKILKEVELQVCSASVLCLLVHNYKTLWNIPADILAQVRFVNEQRLNGHRSKDRKDIVKMLAAKPTNSGVLAALPTNNRLIWVPPNPNNLRAVVIITKDGLDIEGVQIFDHTTSNTILENMKLPTRCTT